ncbi:chondroitinase-B domain-containing protein [Polaribacter sp. Hel1_85]|uniref:chondroitinase-B domain-containing protein n=1 Tax=Polaribacter sp. Hel1_85 TaxID=1250005 RepID=UPI00052CEFFA|nr:chondroitinase-B domain-containing protein [Polaribacter sp. Hel1_85]KGL58841.1 alginate lyase, PL6-1 family [Polaribacter sp. Hel1_85]
MKLNFETVSTLLFVFILLLITSCKENSKHETIFVKNNAELKTAITNATPGTNIVLKDGIYKGAQIKFYAIGTKEKPITLKAENPGKVFFEGKSYLHLGGEYLIVDGLYFRNGYSPEISILRYRIGKDSTAFHSRITNTVIKNFTKPSRLTNDHWIEFYGKHNKIDHCYISGKSNDGETIRVFQDGNKNVSNYHQIVHNYFGPRPRKGGPRAETIRVGDSKTSMSSGFVNVSDNYFEACNGEVEIISDKTNFNTFKNNIFYKCEGSLVLRHGSFSTVDSNIFIGDDDSDFYGGIRLVSTGHFITNNYFYKINGSKFRSPLAVMNGINMSPINRYKQVTDVVVAYNTWVDCKSPIQIGVGQNVASAGVLPKYEIRSAPPIRSVIANNLIYNHQSDAKPFINHDNMEGILFQNNILDNNGSEFTKYEVLQNETVKMKQINDWLFVPETNHSEAFNETYIGYEFDKIKTDLFESSRADKNNVGAITNLAAAEKFKIDTKKYGPSWFSTDKINPEANLINVSKSDDLITKISEAKSGDIINLTDKVYTFKTSLKIDKNVTIQSKNKAQIIFTGDKNTPAFVMNPYGNLFLENIDIKSKTNQITFETLKGNMSAAYNITVNNCTISNFKSIIEVSKGSFADNITFKNTKIKDCKNGIILASEEKGDYNAAMIVIDNCEITNIQQNVIHYYRGGYDESTIGGSLKVTNSTFRNSGSKEKSGILLKTRGIVNVDISGNTFQNNPIKNIAFLWGEKNNHHKENTVIHSGKIKVEQQLKLDILY